MFGQSERTNRVSDTIARRIKKQISDGRLTAGHKLPAERDMARQFKTSRVSVREAYRSLEELGLLRIQRGAEGGAFIAKFDHEPVRRSLSLVLGLGKTSHNEVTEARMLLDAPHQAFPARSKPFRPQGSAIPGILRMSPGGGSVAGCGVGTLAGHARPQVPRPALCPG